MHDADFTRAQSSYDNAEPPSIPRVLIGGVVSLTVTIDVSFIDLESEAEARKFAWMSINNWIDKNADWDVVASAIRVDERYEVGT